MTVSSSFPTYRAVEKATGKQRVLKRVPSLPENTQSLFRENACTSGYVTEVATIAQDEEGVWVFIREVLDSIGERAVLREEISVRSVAKWNQAARR